MKKSFLYIAMASVLLAGGLSSCEDRLDIAKHGNMGGQSDFYKTDQEAKEALASLYVALKGSYFNWFFMKNCLSDDVWAGGGSRGDNAGLEKLNEYTFGTDDGSVAGYYQSMYGIIYQANLIVDQVKGDTPEKKRCIAEAKFYRAWADFELVSLWGTAPIVDHLLAPSEYRPGNSKPEEMWAFIEKDLTEAINADALPSKKDADDRETTIRVTRELAEALLGKAYVFQGKYKEGAAELEKVITSGKYALFTGEYDMMQHAVNNNNCESMIEWQSRNDPKQANTFMSMTYIMQGWRTDHLQYSGQAAAEIAQGTYGFCSPRKSLYDAFVAAEGKDGYRLKSTMRTYEQMKAYGITLQAGVFLPGNEGYFFWKNRILQSDLIINFPAFQTMQYTDNRVMRYAEVLLLAAEAHLQAGNKAKALEYVNQIRKRAKLPQLSDVTLEAVKTEKRLELCLEGVRYQDLVRWGDGEKMLGRQGKEIPSFTTTGVEWNYKNESYGFKERNKLLPIPLKEINLNPNMKQNPNW